MNCDCLQRLERALSIRASDFDAGEISSQPSRYYAVVDVRNAIRAALASKDAPVDIYRDSYPWMPVAAGPAREPPICMGPSARQIAHIQLSELDRLLARDKWIEEHAKPALEKYKGSYVGRSVLGYEQYFADDALAAMPQDAGEPKP
jgi:hypothetical protein